MSNNSLHKHHVCQCPNRVTWKHCRSHWQLSRTVLTMQKQREKQQKPRLRESSESRRSCNSSAPTRCKGYVDVCVIGYPLHPVMLLWIVVRSFSPSGVRLLVPK